MTNEEAIEFFEGCKYHCDNVEFHDMAIQALKKQIPKKPIISGGYGYGKRYMCPICSDVLKYPYPCTCGQKIDWEREEE